MFSRRVLNLTRLGWGLALPVLFLAALGLATIHASDANVGAPPTASAPSSAAPGAWFDRVLAAIGPFTLRQAAYLVTGVVLMLLTLWPSYQEIGRHAYLIYWLGVFFLALLVIDRWVDLPFVPEKRFTRRWIEVAGIGFQPSEFMKVALILALARYMRFRDSIREWRGLVVPFLMTLGPLVLVVFQPDLDTALMMLPMLLAMLFMAGARLRHLLAVVLLGAAIAPVFYVYGMSPYQRTRIDVVLRQGVEDERWHMKEGYQLRQSKIALGVGRVWGEGYRQGAFVEHDFLPEKHNDFIFAIIGNQWGFVGSVLVVLAYVLIVLCAIEVAVVTNDPFGRLLVVGVIVMIVLQALMNIGMTIGYFIITGMTLPFVSYGGSSLWANFIALGLLVNVAQRRPMLIARKPFAYDNE